MNINDYDINYVEEETYRTVDHERPNMGIEEKYIPNSVLSIKGRQDIRGRIDRIEGEEIVVKIMGETYRLPPDKFDSIFYVHPSKSPENWYAKSRDWRLKYTV